MACTADCTQCPHDCRKSHTNEEYTDGREVVTARRATRQERTHSGWAEPGDWIITRRHNRKEYTVKARDFERDWRRVA